METCNKCGKEFGAPATLRMHENKCEETPVKKVVKAVKKAVKGKK